MGKVRVALSIPMIIGAQLTLHTPMDRIGAILILGAVLLLGVTMWVRADTTPHPVRYAMAAATIDGIVIALLPMLWYIAAHPHNPVFLIKSEIEFIALLAIAFSALSLRAAPPVIITVFYVVSQLIYFVIVRSAGPILSSTSWVEVHEGPAIHLMSFWFNTLFSIPALTVIVIAAGLRLRKADELNKKTFSERIRRQRHFLPPGLVESMHSGPRKQTLVILDVSLETSPSDHDQPAIFDCLTAITAAVRSEMGIIVGGTATHVQTAFGITSCDPNPCERSMNCALAIRESVAAINRASVAEHAPIVTLRIGVAFDDAMVHVRKSDTDLHIMVVGAPVQRAQQLVEATHFVAADILTSVRVAEEVEEFFLLHSVRLGDRPNEVAYRLAKRRSEPMKPHESLVGRESSVA